ncbi:galanin receptor type 1 [Gouania willdenowi]|uniref:galanin receptor type 1 n=1 Tax=Gouania willdenowi TaxID=441366 RepID=UPI001055344B|nr:galanin receptor type 1-like [Gouania willdenowi]
MGLTHLAGARTSNRTAFREANFRFASSSGSNGGRLSPSRTTGNSALDKGRSLRAPFINRQIMSEGINGTAVLERSWSEAEKWILVVVLGLEMTMGIVGNILVLLIKFMCRGRFSCRFWFPFLSLTLSDLGCSLLIISGSMLAILTGGQRSPWCEVVSLLKFAFITSSIGSIAVLSVQRVIGGASCGKAELAVVVMVCSGSWVIGVVLGCIPVVYSWIRYDPAEMLCAVFWEQTRYSDMLLYILCSFSICIFLPLILMISCSVMMMIPGCNTCCHSDDDDDEGDLCEVLPLLVAFYIVCYTPFFVSELILLGRRDLSPAPDWLRTLSSVMSYLDCGVNPLIYWYHQGFREAALALLWTRRRPGSEPVLTAIAKLQLA